jgi:hypothetical protein
MKTCLKDQQLPIPLDSGFKMDGYWIWCGSAVEEPGVGYHLFAARWPKTYPMFEGYIYCSEIVRAFSETICGPYRFAEHILPSGEADQWNGKMAHNPTVIRYGERFLLYYIASTYAQPTPDPEHLDPQLQGEIYTNIRIGLATADHPAGPWTSLPDPILEARPGCWDSMIVTNPAPCVHPDGRIFLFYRSNTPNGLRIGLAVADRPEGPYRRLQDEPVMAGMDVEDPFVWHNGTCFEMIAKDMTGDITGEYHSGAHFESDDGIAWRVTPNPKAYSREVAFSDGTSTLLGSLERPQLLFDGNGRPACLFAAAADGPGGFRKALNTWNIAIPLQSER